MTEYRKTKPSFLEAGLPCASLSAECQRDNSASCRPPQNTLHIWWARRPPTISRAAILAALLPHEFSVGKDALATDVEEPNNDDLAQLPPRLRGHEDFLRELLDIPSTELHPSHRDFLKSLGVRADTKAAAERLARANALATPLTLGELFGYRHPPAFSESPSARLINELHKSTRSLLGLGADEPIVVLDQMAGGGSIPLEAIRYGFKVYSNDLNPVASLVQKATLELPSKFGNSLVPTLANLAKKIDSRLASRLGQFIYSEPESSWWPEEQVRANNKFISRNVVGVNAGGPAWTRFTLWARVVECRSCSLNIPLSTNWTVSTKSGNNLAAFPKVPNVADGNSCEFQLVQAENWSECLWPKPDFESWHPRNTPTYKDGKAVCPRCGAVMDGDEIKEIARARSGGLSSQPYAICSQVPVSLTYRDGTKKTRYLWRFRAPGSEDIAAIGAAEDKLRQLLPRWESLNLVPNEEILEGDKTREPRNMGLFRWRDLFIARQLLTNVVFLEECLKIFDEIKHDHSHDASEAIRIYLAFGLSKVVNYNSVNCFWHSGHNKTTQTFSRHDFAFRSAFCESTSVEKLASWGISQVIDSINGLGTLIHGGELHLADEESDNDENPEDTEEDISGEIGHQNIALREEVLIPTVTNEDAAALSVPATGTVHLICVDPPYYNNVQYSELSNFFYVWLKRALADEPGLAHLFREPLAETNREAVANVARWARDSAQEQEAWQQRYDHEFQRLRALKVKVSEAKTIAAEAAGIRPPSAKDRADRFYEDKMAQVFRRARLLLHSAGRMVVMFNHKETYAWRALGMALIRAGFEIRSSVPIHTEAESSLNIRGLDAARSTVLLMCLPREEREQAAGNWASVQSRVAQLARGAAQRFQAQGLSGTDLYLSALGPAIGEVARNWPVTDFAGREVDLEVALNESYRAVGQWRLEQILEDLTQKAEFSEAAAGFAASSADRDSQTLWLWLDTFQGETAQSDDVRKLAKSLNVDPDDFKRMGLLENSKDLFILRPPSETDLKLLSRRLAGADLPRGRAAREADVWEERVFPGFQVAAVWNAIALMGGVEDIAARGPEAVRRWLNASGYGSQREFFGAFAVTLDLLEHIFGKRSTGPWHETVCQARRAWDLVLKNWQI
ncbi:MAG: DUF1156 domain-containing protein [Candidatus Accumulibacter sp.]|nr:DUF1156 domain-containing protein [Accumulibacter sp.]